MGTYNVKKTNTGFLFGLKAGNKETIATSQVYSSKSSAMHGIESVKNVALMAEVEDQTKEKYDTVKNPKFEVYVDKKGEFRFRLKASNGQNLLASEGYTTKAACMNGINSVKKNADSAIVEEDK